MIKLINSKLILFSLLLFFTNSLLAQTIMLSGRVTDINGHGIEFARISIPSQAKNAITDIKGNFKLNIETQDSVKIIFSMVGYKPKTKILYRPKTRQHIVIQLLSNTNLDEIVIQKQVRLHGTTEEIKIDKAKTSPSTSGNIVEELVQTQAGVSTHNEMSSQYNVRGGSFDENFVYINNVEIYRPFLVRNAQQEGLSIINADMVENVGFSTGGFEAKYGDKMSSALDITYKEPKQTEASATISMTGATGYVGLSTKCLKWANSARYKTNKYLLSTLQTKGEYEPIFIDYQTYLIWTPNRLWKVDIIGNISDNKYTFQPKDRETQFGTLKNIKSFKVYFDGQEKDIFRTYFGAINVNRIISKHTNISLIASAFNTKEAQNYDIEGQYWLKQTENAENLGVGSYMLHSRDYLRAKVKSIKFIVNHKIPSHNIEAAITYKSEQIIENSKEYEYRDSAGYNIPHTGKDLELIYSLRAKNALNAGRVESYIQDTWRFKSKDSIPTLYTLNYGIRFSNWSFNNESIFSPRLILNIAPGWNRNLSFRIATGIYYQAPFYKELRQTINQDGVIYATLNQNAKSQQSLHTIAAVSYRFDMFNRPFKLTTEIYYKKLIRVVPYTIDNMKVTYFGNMSTSGKAMGIDFKLFGEFVPNTNSWLTLSLMKATMNIKGHKIPLPTDQRVAINLFFTDYFPNSDKWLMSLRIAYADGLPFAPPHKEFTSTPFKAPAYKRVDLGMNYRLYNGETRHNNSLVKNIWIGIDCLNLLGINNVNSYYWVTDISGQQYAVPNYLTGRLFNGKITIQF